MFERSEFHFQEKIYLHPSYLKLPVFVRLITIKQRF
jgi:hypothetical protein